MTIANYIEGVRDKLSDTVQPYRVSNIRIASSLREALLRARSMRPSICYSAGALVEEAADVDFTLATSTIVRAELDRYSEALVFLAAGRILADDNADTLNVALSDKWIARGVEILAL